MSKLLEDLIKRELFRLEIPPISGDAKDQIRALEERKKEIVKKIKALKEHEAKRIQEIEELKSLLDGSDTNAN